MNRYEKVRAAIDHRQTEFIPSCIHLDGEGIEKYFDPLFERYVKGDVRERYLAAMPFITESAIMCSRFRALGGSGTICLRLMQRKKRPISCPKRSAQAAMKRLPNR